MVILKSLWSNYILRKSVQYNCATRFLSYYTGLNFFEKSNRASKRFKNFIYTRHDYSTHNSQYVSRVNNIAEYNQLIYDPSHLIVALFTAKFSTPSNVIASDFHKFVDEYMDINKNDSPSETNTIGKNIRHVFIHIDIDDCSRCAYHADVDDVPTIVLMKGDDSFRVKISPTNRSEYQDLIKNLSDILDTFDSKPLAEINNWKSKSSWYDHNIRRDNLNVERLNWPTR